MASAVRVFLLLWLGVWSSIVSAAVVESVDAERCQLMKAGDVVHDTAPVKCDRLRVVKFSYVDFQRRHHDDGEIMVMDAVAGPVADIFDDLLKLGFPIHQAKTMEHYKGNDDDSMAANNTSAFVNRSITGKSSFVSLHAYGLALDINPIQNPYISFGNEGKAEFKPVAGTAYANRANERWGKDSRQGMAEEVIDIFARHGFAYWGGYWDTPIDYQHFQTSREMAEFMAAAPYELAQHFFSQYINYYKTCEQVYPVQYQRREFNDYTQWIKQNLKGESLLMIYQSSPKELKQLIDKPVKASPLCVKPVK